MLNFNMSKVAYLAILRQPYSTLPQIFIQICLFIVDDMDWEQSNLEEAQGFVDKNGLSNIEEFFEKKLEGWRDVEVNIAITGSSGAGKSSFINAIRE